MTRNWVAGIFILVVASTFVFFLGNGSSVLDAFQSAGGNQLATVGGQAVMPSELERRIEQVLRQERAQGNNATRNDVIEAGAHLQILEGLIQERALSKLADVLGVTASHAQVANLIRSFPAVQNPLSGTFDQQAYAQFLQEQRYTQEGFEREVRNSISQNMLMQALVSGTRAPSSYGALVLAYESERRTVSVAEAPASLAGDVPAPDAVALQAFYEENRASLQTPEYRAVTLVFARQNDFADRVEVPEERLREEFEARRASLSQPETRTFVQLSAQDEARARDAAARLARGESADAVAEALGLQVVRYDNRRQSDVADSAVGTAAFAMREGAAPQAVRGRLTPWAAVQLQNVTPAVTPSFEDERDRLRQDIAADEAADLLNAAVSAFEDARSGGTPIAEAARANRLTVVQVPAVNAQGLTPAGEPAEAFADNPSLVEVAFETPEGEASDFMPVDDADVIVAVDRVTPAATRPLEEVREQLVEAWRSRERIRRLREIADTMVRAVQGGQSFADAARANRMTVLVRSQAIDRRSAAQIPARALASEMFAAAEGGVVSDMRVDGGAMLVAQVEDIERADPAQASEVVEQMRRQMQQSLQQSMAETITAEAVSRARVRRNERLIERTYTTTDSAETEQN